MTMPDAQPEQMEQRMERDLDAEASAILARHIEYMGWPESGQIMTKTHNAIEAIKEALAARPTPDLGELVRPIIGIENRTPQEVFDIMADRIRAVLLNGSDSS